MSFNGTSDYVDLAAIGAAARWNPDSGQTTIAAWFSPVSIGRRMMVFSDNCLELGITVESNQTACGWTYTSACTTSAIAMNQWHFGVVVLDIITRQLNFYLDGKLEKTTTFGIGNGLRDAPFNIGRDPCAANTNFAGLIDEVRIYGKALTLGEIQKQYAAGVERHQDLATLK